VAVSFADQVMVFLANPANQSTFAGMLGLAAFASASFTRRYGQGGFQISGVTLGTSTGFRLQDLLFDETRITGFREKRSEQPERQWYDLHVRRKDLGWVDASFTVPVQFALQAVPGSIQLGPGGDLVSMGVSDPEPLKHQLKFQLPVATAAFSLDYGAQTYVFVASDPSPVADLRRILGVRRLLEDDPHFLASLDGSPDQVPYLFIQLYPTGSLQGTSISQTAVVQAFATADVLADFISVPTI
jgi:hypothetical protein